MPNFIFAAVDHPVHQWGVQIEDSFPQFGSASPPIAPESLGDVLEHREPVHGWTGADFTKAAHLGHHPLELEIMRSVESGRADAEHYIAVTHRSFLHQRVWTGVKQKQNKTKRRTHPNS